MPHRLILCFLLLIPSFLIAQTDKPADSTEEVASEAQTSLNSFIVFFPSGSAEVDPSYQSDLQQLAEQLQANPDTIQIFGFTDDIGQVAANQALARRRSESVKRFLIELGVNTDLMEVFSIGEDRPQADNATENGRSQNRRVEISYSLSENDTTVATEEIYEESQADELLQSIRPPEGARLIERPLPPPTADANLDLRSMQPEIVGSNGSTVMATYGYNSGDSRPLRVLIQTRGANSFYDVPVSVTRNIGQLNIPLALPTNLSEGQFEVVACLINEAGQLSAPDTLLVRMERLGTGKLQISLSWDNESDQDLHLQTPARDVIYYRNQRSSDGGTLDRDDVTGFGPENIFWQDKAPNGEYLISVNDYDSDGRPNNFVVTFNFLGETRQFFGTTRNGSTAIVGRFRKTDDGIEWLE